MSSSRPYTKGLTRGQNLEVSSRDTIEQPLQGKKSITQMFDEAIKSINELNAGLPISKTESAVPAAASSNGIYPKYTPQYRTEMGLQAPSMYYKSPQYLSGLGGTSAGLASMPPQQIYGESMSYAPPMRTQYYQEEHPLSESKGEGEHRALRSSTTKPRYLVEKSDVPVEISEQSFEEIKITPPAVSEISRRGASKPSGKTKISQKTNDEIPIKGTQKSFAQLLEEKLTYGTPSKSHIESKPVVDDSPKPKKQFLKRKKETVKPQHNGKKYKYYVDHFHHSSDQENPEPTPAQEESKKPKIVRKPIKKPIKKEPPKTERPIQEKKAFFEEKTEQPKEVIKPKKKPPPNATEVRESMVEFELLEAECNDKDYKN